jgi:hypothetical protein
MAAVKHSRRHAPQCLPLTERQKLDSSSPTGWYQKERTYAWHRSIRRRMMKWRMELGVETPD